MTLRSRSHKMLPSTIHIMWPMQLRTLKLLCPMVKEKVFTRKYIIWPWLQGQGHMKCCLVPSTSCDLCTCKIWSCYFKKFMRCVYKKIHYLTFDLGLGVKVTWNVVSTLYIMWSMHVQGWNCYVQSLQETWHMDRQRTNFGTKLIYPIFLTKKRVLIAICYKVEVVF